MTKLLISIYFCMVSTISFGAESIVFQGFPNKKDSKSVTKKEAAQHGVLIKKINGKYVWASRQDKELLYSQSGIFHIFISTSGSGFISIMDSSAIPESMRDKGPPIVYGEHIRNGVNVISYTGNAHFVKP